MSIILLFMLAAGKTAVADTPSAADSIAVEGFIFDRQRNPVPDATAFAFNPIDENQVPVTTEANGHFRIDNLIANEKYTFVFHPPDGVGLASTAMRDVDPDTIENPLIVTLEPGFAVTGTVTTSDGGETAVYPFAQNDLLGFGLPTLDAGDTFTFNLAAGDWELTFTPDALSGYIPEKVNITVPYSEPLDIVLWAGGFTVQGKVTGNGAGIPGVEIVAKSLGDPVFGFTPTDANGDFAGPLSVNVFPYDLIYIAPPFSGFGSTVKVGVTGQAGGVVDGSVTLPAGFTLSGLISCQGGLANAFVFADPRPPLSAGNYNYGWGDFAGEDGRFRLALQPGTYDLAIVPPENTGLAEINDTITVDQDLTLDYDFDCPEPPPPCSPDAPNAILGTEENDRLIGTPGDDVIIGFGGNDFILGMGGDDCIDGGTGQDMIRGNGGNDLIFGGPDTDFLNGGSGNDEIYGGPGHDRLQGESGNDLLDGGDGLDRLNGRSGIDICKAGEITKKCFAD
ncbi:MAG: hypothetical protein KC421_09045 [Anaerolineales bacterium]|nr:hypothetical protein [Anaerolineales bacterium]